MKEFKIEITGDTMTLSVGDKVLGGKWKNKRWHAILDGAWTYQIDARHFPKCIRHAIVTAEKTAGWR